MRPERLLISIFFLATGISSFAQGYNQALSLYNSKKHDQAFAAFNLVKKGDPNYAESRYYMGMISTQKKDLSEAEEYLGQALSVNNEVAKYHLAMVNIYGQQVASAGTLKQATYASRIKTHMEEAARLDPGDINTRFMLIAFYSRAPKMMGGDMEKAKLAANQVLKVNRAEGFRALATVAIAQEKFPEAETNYKSALAASPDSLKYYTGLGNFYQSRSQYDNALAVYEQAIKKFPSNRNLLMQAGRVASLSGTKNSETGLKYLNAYVKSAQDKKDRNLANAYYYMGLIEKDKKNIPSARTHFAAALEINPSHQQSQKALDDLK
jgi:tetratricopeptide (TPR) repeat protein